MADDTTYTVVEDVDTTTGLDGSSSFYEGNGVNASTPTGGTDDTNYAVVGDLSSMGQGAAGNSSFFEQGNIYEALELAPDLLNQITTQANAVNADRLAADADSAAALASQNAAASSASASATSATASAGSAAAALTSANNAHTSELNAASSASTATTQAGTATTQAGIATTEAGIATTKAGNAATSETNAATSATNAHTSELNAASSATAAATSATNAAAAVQAAAGTAAPLVNGTAAVGTGTKWAHEDHVHPTDTSRAPTANPTFTGTVTVPTPTVGDNSTKAASTAFVAAAVTGAGVSSIDTATGAILIGDALARSSQTIKVDAASMRGFIGGLTLSMSGTSNVLNITAGVAIDSTAAAFLKLTSAFTKTTGAWSSGTGGGILDTGSIAASTWYWIFLIKNPTSGSVDILATKSVSGGPAVPSLLPTGYTLYRYIGSARINSSSFWQKYVQYGDLFVWPNAIAEVNTSTMFTSLNAYTLAGVPLGVSGVTARTRGLVNSSVSGNDAVVQGGDELTALDGDANTSNRNLETSVANVAIAYQLDLVLNTAAQFNAQSFSSGAIFRCCTYAFIDPRGRYQ